MVEDELAAIVAEAGTGDPDFSAEVRILASREPFEVPADAEIVRLVRERASRVLGTEPEIVGVPFWADSALLAAAGIPTVLFGPRGEGAHGEVEWVEVDDLGRCAQIYVAVASEFCR